MESTKFGIVSSEYRKAELTNVSQIQSYNCQRKVSMLANLTEPTSASINSGAPKWARIYTAAGGLSVALLNNWEQNKVGISTFLP